MGAAASLEYPLGESAPGPGALLDAAPGVRWLRLPVDDTIDFINLWVLDDGDGYAIVDSGVATAESRALWERLFAGPLAGRAATRLICTHHHADHSGLTAWLAERLSIGLVMPRAEWLTARDTCAEMAGDIPPETLAMWRFGGWSEAEIERAVAAGWGFYGEAMQPPPRVFTPLVAGSILRVGQRRYKVIVTSGHSPEQAALWDEAGGVLIASDMVLPDRLSGLGMRACDLHTDTLGEWLAGAQALRSLPADVLVLPSHGRPFRGLHARLDEIESTYRRRCERLAEFCAEPRTVAECFPMIFRRPVSDWLRPSATGEILAYLNHLGAIGRIDCRRRGATAIFQTIRGANRP